MKTSILWGFADIQGQNAEAWGGACMSDCYKKKARHEAFVCHTATQSTLPVGQSVHLANPALFLLQTGMLRIPELNLNYHMT